MSKPNRYQAIIEKIFTTHFDESTEFEFDRDELVAVANELDIDLPKNLGDLIYSFRYRNELPESITSTATNNREWIIEGAGQAKYRFKQDIACCKQKFPELICRAVSAQFMDENIIALFELTFLDGEAKVLDEELQRYSTFPE